MVEKGYLELVLWWLSLYCGMYGATLLILQIVAAILATPIVETTSQCCPQAQAYLRVRNVEVQYTISVFGCLLVH